MEVRQILLRIWNIIVRPSSIWQDIKNEATNKTNLFLRYIFPLLLVVTIAKLIQSGFFSSDTDLFESMISSVSYLLVAITSFFISVWLIREISIRFFEHKLSGEPFVLVVFSSIPVLLTDLVSSIFPHLIFIRILSVYGVYVFWIGVPFITNIALEKRMGFVLVSGLLVLIVVLLLTSFVIPFLLYMAELILMY